MQSTAPQEDITNVDLDGVLPSATIMVVSVTASTTAGQPLPDAEIEQVRPAAAASAAEALQLDLDLSTPCSHVPFCSWLSV